MACGAEMYKSITDDNIVVVGYRNINGEDESLSVWDATDIYASNGFDEDYRFGYTHEELMKALYE